MSFLYSIIVQIYFNEHYIHQAQKEDAMMMKQPPSDKGKQLKIYYVTQVGVKPPLFSFQVNKRELMHFSYARYLENKLREAYDFSGTSVKFVFREKGEKDLG